MLELNLLKRYALRHFTGITWAVFNCDKPDLAGAKRAFVKRYGLALYREHIKPIIQRGIMTLFHNTPNEYTLFYAEVLALLADKRHARRVKRETTNYAVRCFALKNITPKTFTQSNTNH